MNRDALIAYLIAGLIIIGLLRFAASLLRPRKTHDPYAEAHGWEERQ